MVNSDLPRIIRLCLFEVWLRRWRVLACAWLVAAAGIIIVASLPDRYGANARIQVNIDSLLQPLLKGLTVQPDLSGQVALVRKTLLSRPNVQKLIRETDLDYSVPTPEQEEALISRLQREVEMRAEGVHLVNIQYSHSDPIVAQRVVQAVLNLFIEQNVGNNRRDLEKSLRFIDAQIADYEARLEATEQAVAEFRRVNARELIGQERTGSMLERAEAEIKQLEGELASAIWQKGQLEMQLAQVPATLPSLPFAVAPAAPSAAEQRVAELRSRLNEQLLSKTNAHPDIVQLKRQLAAAEAEASKAPAAQAPRSTSRATRASGNPDRRRLSDEVNAVVLQIGILKQRLASKQEEADKLRLRMNNVPEVQLTLAQMNRDYERLRTTYNELTGRREAARMAQDLERESEGLDIRIVEPPSASLRPTSPNRLLLLGGVFAAAIGAGLGLPLLQMQLRNSFRSAAELRDYFDIPVLGSLSVVWSPLRSRLGFAEKTAWGAATLSLVFIFGVAYSHAILGLRIEPLDLLGRLTGQL